VSAVGRYRFTPIISTPPSYRNQVVSCPFVITSIHASSVDKPTLIRLVGPYPPTLAELQGRQRQHSLDKRYSKGGRDTHLVPRPETCSHYLYNYARGHTLSSSTVSSSRPGVRCIRLYNSKARCTVITFFTCRATWHIINMPSPVLCRLVRPLSHLKCPRIDGLIEY
jgi:hypothetical protein